MNFFKRLTKGVLKGIWLVLKAALTAGLVAGLLWGGFQGWHLWLEHQRGELVKVQLTSQTEHVTEETLKTLLKPQLGLGFWQLDLPMIRKQIETYPWVAHAEVSRFWPNTLRVEVVEQVPVARWGDDALLNQTGDIFYPKEEIHADDLIKLSAVNPEPKEVLSMLRQLLDLINPYGLHVKVLYRQADGSWKVSLVDGDEWFLPNQDPISVLKQLLVLYGSLPRQENANMRIDLRYRDGFAVKWTPNDNARNDGTQTLGTQNGSQ